MTKLNWDNIGLYGGFLKTWDPNLSVTGKGSGWEFFRLKVALEDFDASNIFGGGFEGFIQDVAGKIIPDSDVEGAWSQNELLLFDAFWGQEDEVFRATAPRRWLSLRYGNEVGIGFGEVTCSRPEREINGVIHEGVSSDFKVFTIRKTNYLSFLLNPFDSRFTITPIIGFSTGIAYPLGGQDKLKEIAKDLFPYNPQFAQIFVGAEIGWGAKSIDFKNPLTLTTLDIVYHYYTEGIGAVGEWLSYKTTNEPIADALDAIDDTIAGDSNGDPMDVAADGDTSDDSDTSATTSPSMYDVPLTYAALELSRAIDVTKRFEFFLEAPAPWNYIDGGLNNLGRSAGYFIAGHDAESSDIPLLAGGFSSLSNTISMSETLLGLEERLLPFTRWGQDFGMFLVGGVALVRDSDSHIGEALVTGAMTNLISVSLSPDPGDEGFLSGVTLEVLYGWEWGDVDSPRGGVGIRRHFKDIPIATEVQVKTPLFAIDGVDAAPTDIAAIISAEWTPCIGSVVCFDLAGGVQAVHRFTIEGNDGGAGLRARLGARFKLSKRFELGPAADAGVAYFFRKEERSEDFNFQLQLNFIP